MRFSDVKVIIDSYLDLKKADSHIRHTQILRRSRPTSGNQQKSIRWLK